MENEKISLTVLEETVELVLVFDQSGKILYGNPSAREKLGYTEEELSECGMTSVFRQEFQREDGTFSPFDIKALMEKTETVMYRKISSCFPVTLRIFSAEDGTYYLMAEDITWRENMDMRIRQLKDEEKQNRQMQNEFTANVTHELRTPVNGIKGHVMTLLENVENAEQRKTLDIILGCCNTMSFLIANILEFSKIGAGKLILDEKEFDFYKMMDQVLAAYMDDIHKKDLRISVYIDENIPQTVIGDSGRISQILSNLLSNAVKFTLVGQVSVDVSKTMQVNDEIELFFMVRDTGIGISMEEQDELFKSFKQVDASKTRRFGGTGLGLTIAKELVEMMNGAIHVESEKGKGSCFSFNLRLHVNPDADESKDLKEAYQKWTNLTAAMGREEQKNLFEFGSEDNKAEIKRRMEKLILAIELGSWEKAESLAATIKALTENEKDTMKKLILRLEMAIRKENYEKSLAAYENIKAALEEKMEI